MIQSNQTNSFNIKLFLLTLLLYVISYLLMTHAFMFWEVSWHIVGAERMIDGGTYLTNLFDDNSPPVFAFYIPLAALFKFIPIPKYQLGFLYILFVFGISHYVTLQILKKTVTDSHAIHSLYFSVVMATLLFGITIIGERENIIVCLFMPYLLMNLLNRYDSQANQNISITLQTVIALLAAISLSQVPFYLLIPLLIDSIDCIGNKKKPQTYQTLFYLFFASIFSISYLLYPEYYSFLLKLLYHFQTGFDNTYTSLVSNSFFKYMIYTMILTTFFSLYFYRKLIYLKLIIIVLASLLIYLLEKKVWFYHFYPIICFTFLTFVFIYLDNRATRHKKTDRLLKRFLMLVYAAPLLIIIASIYSNYFDHFLLYKNKDSTLNKLIAFSKSTNPNDNATLFISTRVYPAYLLALYGNLDVVSPWGNNWTLPTLINFKNDPKKIKQYDVGKKWLFHFVLTTLKQKSPRYIIYYQSIYMPYVNIKNFDVLNYLKQSKGISNQLKYYQPLKKIDQYRILKRQGQE